MKTSICGGSLIVKNVNMIRSPYQVTDVGGPDEHSHQIASL